MGRAHRPRLVSVWIHVGRTKVASRDVFHVVARKNGKRIKLRHVAIALPLLCLIGGFIVNAVTHRNAHAAVEAELAKLKAMGIPLTPEEMVRTVPPAENAAPIYARAIITFKSIGQPEINGFRSTTLTKEERASYRKLILEHSPTLALIEEASRKPFCEWNRNWVMGPFLVFTEFPSMKAFGKLMVSKAYLEAESGQFEAAIHWLETGRKLARHAREPSLIAMFVSLSIELAILAEFQQLLKEHGASANFRRAANKFLLDPGSLPSIREAMKGEVVSHRVVIAGLAEGRPGYEWDSTGGHGPTHEDQVISYMFRIDSIRTSIEARVLMHYRQQIEAIGQGGFRKELAASADMDKNLTADQSWSGRIVSEIFPVYHYSGEAVTKLEATRRLCRSGLDLWEIKAKTGAFPTKYTAGIDPFTDKPFIYKKTSQGFKLYSVGPNQKDEGGAYVTYELRTDDIEFCPPPRRY